MDRLYRTTVEPVLLRERQQCGEEAEVADLASVLHRAPKLDFHCHLNGSVSASLLAHLERLLIHGGAPVNGADGDSGRAGDAEAGHILFFDSQEKRRQNVLTVTPADSADRAAVAAAATPTERMHYCFTVFDAIYKVMTNLAFTRLAVQDMLFTSAEENIIVMEIRTSMRDGLRRTFRRDAADEEVTKQMYVDTVIETVEHILSGGLVDLATGELLTAGASAQVLAWGAASVTQRGAAEDEAGEQAAAAPWWQLYERVYGSLLQPPCESSCVQERRRYFLEHIFRNLTERMHVRLLLSVNRGATAAAAWEAARLTTKTQQRQVMEFHSWCTAHMRERNGEEARRGTANNDSSSPGSPTSATPSSSSPSSCLHRRLRETCWVTGMDLSGNCYKGKYAELEPALAAARRGEAEEQDSSGIRVTPSITIHAGEKQDPQELHEMVLFAPERWGHLVFTDPADLSAILAAQQGIELCLTSNMLTGGHSHVVDHHLGDLLQLWESMPESRRRRGGDTEGRSAFPCYAATEAVRLAHRQARAMRRCGNLTAVTDPSGAADADSSDAASTFVLPNISFHTDDRGVFGTTLSKELLLASQHPAIRQLCNRLTANAAGATSGDAAAGTPSTAALAHFFWLFERLSLAQLFELPLPVQLLAAALYEHYSCASESVAAHKGGALEVLQGAETGDWRDWPSFVRVCNSVAASPVEATATLSATPLPSRLSRWEWAWLTKCFDRYYD
ncbi:conserved hypothetical protein [Leishmania infantum JPCM5]|uniref:Uncharacterized protein n=2 Tax=Leishmania infantum TaxID=5671 RepID=A4HUJ6_LEIIN|nr:conserved hypothetical protein [Leishmania infantum JPCM5]CAC9458197.1 hypothetical_protein_-_conserved [Leishmania infantum]CAM66104.1 conserved hypothetical protein [Leishmania infantum JPCM5]SUZ39721.1 hypothetical_protein_-_conserved [Leishmania infantum]|eukprot:XP_001463737.1 conserved hypothetical protein [Leishmania infantum JPCM5]